MLRIVFGADDLARTRVAGGADPMWETLLSLYRLRRKDDALVFDTWRRQARGRVPATARMIADLAPPTGYAADFLTPLTAEQTLEAGLAELVATPRTRLRTDLSRLATTQKLPAWTRELAAGRSSAVRALAEAVRQYFDACLAPHWRQVSTQVSRERSRLTQRMAEGGCERLLAGVHPNVRWRSPVLEVDFPWEHEVHLDGRGLVLVPSFFCLGLPTTFYDGDFQPTLVYSIAPGGWSTTDALATLLGRTRARVLEAVGQRDAITTTELAELSRTPLSTASRQASVLREAGLVSTVQHGQTVRHSLTPLGTALLGGAGGHSPVRVPAALVDPPRPRTSAESAPPRPAR